MPVTGSQRQRGFHIMAKPTGPGCNLDCAYCFYLAKAEYYPSQKQWLMPPDVLENFIRQYIEAQPAKEVHFAWQGGEPTLAGRDFFEDVVRFQARHANGRTIHNAFQTNGVLLDDEWAAFLAEHGFLVGISIDGPEPIHDAYRVDRGGRPVFNKVMHGLEALQRHNVEYNTLTCLHAKNAGKPKEIYRFLKDVGSRYLQFIPIVEPAVPGGFPEPRDSENGAAPPELHPATVGAEDFGGFLVGVFDEWVKRDVGRIFVQHFDTALEAWVGYDPGLCVFSRRCGNALVIEHNGDVYACDHYVYPEHHRGNILEAPLNMLVHCGEQEAFGAAKEETLPPACQSCAVRFACNGGCPKYRFVPTAPGDPPINYLCPGYQRFFNHIDPYMRFMAAELQAGRPPANVMAYANSKADSHGSERHGPSLNGPCPCGSGRKFKRCCGRKRTKRR